MKQLYFLLLLAAVGLSSCDPNNNTAKLASDEEIVSYQVGLQTGRDYRNKEIPLSANAFYQGLLDGYSGNPSLLSEQDMQKALERLQEQLLKHRESKQIANAQSGRTNRDFFADYSQQEGVQKTASGIHYRIQKSGTGVSPAAQDKVTVHYRGTLTDGTEFDSSYKRNQPAQFALNSVIPGWTEALQLMKEGDKWEVVLPAALAYGSKGAAPLIPPNAILIFEIELIKVN